MDIVHFGINYTPGIMTLKNVGQAILESQTNLPVNYCEFLPRLVSPEQHVLTHTDQQIENNVNHTLSWLVMTPKAFRVVSYKLHFVFTILPPGINSPWRMKAQLTSLNLISVHWFSYEKSIYYHHLCAVSFLLKHDMLSISISCLIVSIIDVMNE